MALCGISGADCILGLPPMFHAGGWGIPYACLAVKCFYVFNTKTAHTLFMYVYTLHTEWSQVYNDKYLS